MLIHFFLSQPYRTPGLLASAQLRQEATTLLILTCCLQSAWHLPSVVLHAITLEQLLMHGRRRLEPHLHWLTNWLQILGFFVCLFVCLGWGGGFLDELASSFCHCLYHHLYSEGKLCGLWRGFIRYAAEIRLYGQRYHSQSLSLSSLMLEPSQPTCTDSIHCVQFWWYKTRWTCMDISPVPTTDIFK